MKQPQQWLVPQSVFFDNNAMELEINNKKIIKERSYIWKILNAIINNHGSTKKKKN